MKQTQFFDLISADDMTLIAKTIEDLQNNIEILNGELMKMNMIINI